MIGDEGDDSEVNRGGERCFVVDGGGDCWKKEDLMEEGFVRFAVLVFGRRRMLRGVCSGYGLKRLVMGGFDGGWKVGERCEGR